MVAIPRATALKANESVLLALAFIFQSFLYLSLYLRYYITRYEVYLSPYERAIIVQVRYRLG